MEGSKHLSRFQSAVPWRAAPPAKAPKSPQWHKIISNLIAFKILLSFKIHCSQMHESAGAR
jgi:hypothetical protein